MIFRYIVILILGLSFSAYSQEEKAMAKDNHLDRKRELVEAIRGADKLEVISPERLIRRNQGEKEEVLFTIKGKEKLQEFLNSLEFKKEQTGGSCLCNGTYHLRISREGIRVATINYQHHIALRWGGKSWIGDSTLTEESINNMLVWFTKNGFKQPEIDYREELEYRKNRRERMEFILSHFDKKTCEMLELPDSSSDPLNPNAINAEKKSELLYQSFDNKEELLEITCVILGTRAGSTGYNYYESTILESAELIHEDSIRNFIQSQSKKSNDVKKGLNFLLFDSLRLTKQLYELNESEIQELVAFWLEQEHEYDSAIFGMSSILNLNSNPLTQLFRPYIKGDKEIKVKRENGSLSPDVNLRCLMALKCAENGDESIAKICAELLEKRISPLERSILKIAKALLDGNLSEISRKDFDYQVSFLTNSRIQLAKKHPSLKSYDILVAGTEHAYANDREQSVIAVEALTGKKWFQNQEHERAEWHGKDVRAWWAKERESYKFPE